MEAKIEVVITKRKSDDDGRDFILKTLLNYNPKSRAVLLKDKGCVIKNKHWELADKPGPKGYWLLDPHDNKELQQPIPSKDFPTDSSTGGGGEAPEDAQLFWRYRITLEVPMARTAPAAEKAAAEKK